MDHAQHVPSLQALFPQTLGALYGFLYKKYNIGAKSSLVSEGVFHRLVRYACRLRKPYMWLTHPHLSITHRDCARAVRILDAYCIRGTPEAYCTHTAPFGPYTFAVNAHTLIPREITYGMVEHASQILRDALALDPIQSVHIAEFGVGSGCVLLSVLYNISTILDMHQDTLKTPLVQAYGIDCSKGALLQARENCSIALGTRRCSFVQQEASPKQLKAHNALRTHIERNTIELFFEQADMLALEHHPNIKLHMPLDMLLINPPYISMHEYERLSKSVLHEPMHALHAASNGLDFYQRLLPKMHNMLKPHGVCIMEVGHNQAQIVAALACQEHYKNVQVLGDNEEHGRFVQLVKV